LRQISVSNFLVKTKLILVVLFALVLVLIFVLNRFRVRPMPLSLGANSSRNTAGVKEAPDTCISSSDPTRVVLLRVSNGGRISINSEPVDDQQLPQRLRQIYRTRAQRVLYFLADADTSSRRIADIVDAAQHIPADTTGEWPVPKELQSTNNVLNIQLRLVTSRAINARCPNGYFNFVTQGLPVSP
jgi:biopolymer transport protein ExbD